MGVYALLVIRLAQLVASTNTLLTNKAAARGARNRPNVVTGGVGDELSHAASSQSKIADCGTPSGTASDNTTCGCTSLYRVPTALP